MYILYNRLITALNEKKPDSTEFYIAKMMIWNLWELPRMSISDVAKMCAVSKSTISKFVRDIGFEDYLDFKLEAVRQGKKEIYNSNGKCNITDYIRGHGIWEYEKILSEDIRSVLFGIEEDQLKRLAVDLHEYKHLAAFGISYSESAAWIFRSIGLERSKLKIPIIDLASITYLPDTKSKSLSYFVISFTNDFTLSIEFKEICTVFIIKVPP